VFNDLSTWSAPGVDPPPPPLRPHTCNGCHSSDETNVVFLQIEPRFLGSESFLSAFLVGGAVRDRFTQEPRFFDDLGRRKVDLEAFMCPTSSLRPTANLRKGFARSMTRRALAGALGGYGVLGEAFGPRFAIPSVMMRPAPPPPPPPPVLASRPREPGHSRLQPNRCRRYRSRTVVAAGGCIHREGILAGAASVRGAIALTTAAPLAMRVPVTVMC